MLIFSLLSCLCSLIQATKIVFVRFDNDQAYVALNLPRLSLTPTQDEAIQVLAAAGKPLEPHFLMLFKRTTHVLFATDTGLTNNGADGWLRLTPEQAAGMRNMTAAVASTRALAPKLEVDDRPSIGLINIKYKTCYLNAFVQCLYHIPEFVRKLTFYTTRYLFDQEEHSVSGSLLKVFLAMDEATLGRGVVQSRSTMMRLVEAINETRSNRDMFSTRHRLLQMDSSDILQSTLEAITNEFNQFINPFLGGLFDELLQIEMLAVITSYVRNVPEVQPAQPLKSYMLNISPPRDVIDDSRLELAPLLDSFFLAEETRVRNVLMTSTKRDLIKLPPYLFISVNRADSQLNRCAFALNFPLTSLDLSHLVFDTRLRDSSPYVYDLKAVVLHEGSSMKKGHYVTAILVGNGWLLLDDEEESPLRFRRNSAPTQIQKRAAYLLYQRRT